MNYPQNDNPSQLEMYVDNEMARHLGDTAKWGKFLAIAGLIMSGIFFIAFAGGFLSMTGGDDEFSGLSYREVRAVETGTIMLTLVLMLILVVWPCVLLLRTSIKLKSALMASNQVELTNAFRLQKNLYMFMGIVTIIYLVIIVLGLLVSSGGRNDF